MNEIEKLKKEIEDLKLIIESKNNQVESKNKHIKRLERIISNIKKNNPDDSGRQSRPTNPLTKRTCRLLLGTPQNPRQYRRLGAKLGVYPATNYNQTTSPSDYKLPLGEQAVRTEPSRMGGDSSIDFAFLFIMVYKMVYMVNYLKLTLN